ERNIQLDVRYFKTSSPGDSTKNIVAASQDPVKVLLFFPEPNEVLDQVDDYFEALASATGKVQIEKHDRLIDAELAGKYKVTKDGTIVMVRGTGDKEKSGTIDVDTDLQKARNGSKLRNFDREVNSQLRKLLAEKRKAYLTSGHGEVTDPESMPPEVKGKVPERRTTAFRKRLTDLDYEVKELGLVDLVKDVPQDANVVIMLAPTVPLQPAEWSSLERYLDRGGRLLIALDPTAEPSMGGLEGKLGLKFNPGHLTDDQAFLPQRGNASDRRFVITTQFSAHASTTALSRAARSGLVLIDAGALEDVPFASKGDHPRKTITIHSMETSWLDYDNNFAFDSGTEKRQKWNIAAAIEGPKVKGADGKDKDGWRALVFADVDLFGDALVQSMGHAAIAMVSDIGGGLLDNSMDWLVGKEVFAGDVVSEDDKPIEQTKGRAAKWFLGTIVGAPLLVLALGLVGTLTRRRRSTKQSAKSAEVKP
ncbi:MAG: Gldg family protein, partial [Acidobacteriota bacterium]